MLKVQERMKVARNGRNCTMNNLSEILQEHISHSLFSHRHPSMWKLLVGVHLFLLVRIHSTVPINLCIKICLFFIWQCHSIHMFLWKFKTKLFLQSLVDIEININIWHHFMANKVFFIYHPLHNLKTAVGKWRETVVGWCVFEGEGRL